MWTTKNWKRISGRDLPSCARPEEKDSDKTTGKASLDTVRDRVLKTNLVTEELGKGRFRNKVQLPGLPSPSKKLSGCSLPLILPVSGSLHVWTSLAFASWSVSKG